MPFEKRWVALSDTIFLEHLQIKEFVVNPEKRDKKKGFSTMGFILRKRNCIEGRFSTIYSSLIAHYSFFHYNAYVYKIEQYLIYIKTFLM